MKGLLIIIGIFATYRALIDFFEYYDPWIKKRLDRKEKERLNNEKEKAFKESVAIEKWRENKEDYIEKHGLEAWKLSKRYIYPPNSSHAQYNQKRLNELKEENYKKWLEKQENPPTIPPDA